MNSSADTLDGRGESTVGTTQVLWFRRDLRLLDNPALIAAAEDEAEVVPLYVLDERLLKPVGHHRVAWILASVHAPRTVSCCALISSLSPMMILPRSTCAPPSERSASVHHDTAPTGLASP